MEYEIPGDHYIFQIDSQMKSLSKEFLSSMGLSYFQYCRGYKDGSAICLLTDTKVLKKFRELDMPVSISSYKESNEDKADYWFLWDEDLPEDPVQIGREQGVHHGITYLRRGDGYYDMIAFAMDEERDGVSSYYINNLHKLKHFINDFDKSKVKLIKEAYKNRLIIPEKYRDKNYKSLCLNSNQRFYVGNSYITSREYSCLRFREQGMSIKEIGRILSISPRSVETYFARMRERTKRYDLSEIYRHF